MQGRYAEGKRGPVSTEICALTPKKCLTVVPLAQRHRNI